MIGGTVAFIAEALMILPIIVNGMLIIGLIMTVAGAALTGNQIGEDAVPFFALPVTLVLGGISYVAGRLIKQSLNRDNVTPAVISQPSTSPSLVSPAPTFDDHQRFIAITVALGIVFAFINFYGIVAILWYDFAQSYGYGAWLIAITGGLAIGAVGALIDRKLREKKAA